MRSSSRSILIVSDSDDLHAHAVRSEIARMGGTCFQIASDELSGSESFNLLFEADRNQRSLIRTMCGSLMEVEVFGCVWWRRYRTPQQLGGAILSADEESLLNNDCVAALRGALESGFNGKWISSPSATENASNKIRQLAAACSAGFRVPATLISQSPSAVREFHAKYRSVIYKPVAGTRGPLLFTRFLTAELLANEASILTCPTIYQEFVPGELHIRLNKFGRQTFASVIETGELDWRPNLNVPIIQYSVPEGLEILVERTLDLLGLEMGIFDIKLTPDGEYIFLEVNPQGQFLFLEAATGEPLARHMANYLFEECQLSSCGRSAGQLVGA